MQFAWNYSFIQQLQKNIFKNLKGFLFAIESPQVV
jgi:hypothetical protein